MAALSAPAGFEAVLAASDPHRPLRKGAHASRVPPRTESEREAAEERDLVARAREGDADAFSHLVKRYQGRAYGLALRILRDPSLAEDAVQEALIKAYAGLHRFEGRCRFYTWLYRLVTNQCLDMRRRDPSRRWVDPEGPNGIDEQPALDDVDPMRNLHRRQLGSRLGQALERLGADARRTLLLREVDELSYAEIARVEEIPVGTVMSRLYYARRRLREILGSAEGDRPGSGPAGLS